MNTERVSLKTSDGIDIVGNYRADGSSKKAAILLHMMPATKESWNVFEVELDHAGYASIAIDERGHGESTMNGTLDYKQFSEDEQQSKIHDVESAFEFLKAKGFAEKDIILVGASIGANLTIQFLADHASVPIGIALSPGLNYRGVKTDGFIQQFHDGQKIYLVASDDDDRDSAESCRKLHELNLSQTILIEKQGIGHGTNMFAADPGLMQELIDLLPKS